MFENLSQDTQVEVKKFIETAAFQDLSNHVSEIFYMRWANSDSPEKREKIYLQRQAINEFMQALTRVGQNKLTKTNNTIA